MSDEKNDTSWALVTGASQGLGAAIARRLAADGYDVVAMARNQSKLDALASDIEQQGKRCLPIACDFSDPASVSQSFDKLAAENISIDVLVNNAGMIGPIGPLLETAPEEWEATVNLNLFGVMRCLRASVPFFSEGRIVIVNISSGASQNAMEGWSAYCASKAALAMVTKSLAKELSDRCFSYGFQPGLVDTDMQVLIRQSGVNPVSKVPKDQLLPPEDPATIVGWLCKERPEDLHGTEFRADNAGIRKRAGLAAV